MSLSDAFKEEIRQNMLHKYSEMNEKTDESRIQAEVEQIFHDADPDIEVKVRMININHGHNREMLSKCRPLGEYAWFVAQVRNNQADVRTGEDDAQTGIGSAIDRAIDEMPEDFEIKKFITVGRVEVKDMCLTEYNEAEAMDMLRQEERLETRLLDIKNLMDSTGWTAEKAMDTLKIPKDQRISLYVDLFRKE